MATTLSSSFAFYTTVQAPPEFHEFIRNLVAHVVLPSKKTPPVTEDHVTLYIQAFVGPSSKPVIGNNVETNKHLEFVGDAALNLSATLWLRRKFPREDVGRLTHRRQCMVGNNSGLMDLARCFELEKYVIGQFNRGGKKLLPNVVEAIIGVMQQLHDFEYVNAFLSPLFDEHAEEWFERYLPEGVKMDIAKSAAMAAQAAQAAQAASSNATNMPSASASPMPDQPGFMSDLPPLGATMSYRNELDEYLLRRRIMFPNSYCGDLRVSFEQAGEDNRTQWVARVQIEVDNGEILYKFAQGLSKKVAQNEACYLLLKEVQKYDAQVRMNYGPSPTSSYPPPSPAFPSPSPAHVPPSSDYVSPTPAYASPTTPAYASPTTPAYPTSSLVSSYSTFYDSSAAFNRKRSHSDYSSDLRGSAPTSSASSVTSRSTMSRLNSEFDSISMQQPPYGGSSQYYSSRSSSPPTSISSGPSSSSHMPQYPLHPSSHPQPTPPPPEAAPRPLFPMTTFSDMLPTSNYKGLLLTLCQRNRGIVPIPEYASGKEGPHHAPHFWAQVKVGEFVGMGKGQKKIEAEQSAAKDVLSKMCGETVK